MRQICQKNDLKCFNKDIWKLCSMKHLDIKEDQYNKSPKTEKNYFWPFPFSMPMRDPYYTGPMSEPVLSPAGGIVMPRRNPYYVKPTNPFLNPYTTQYRHTLWPMSQSLPRTGAAGSCPHHGIFCPSPISGGIGPRPMNPYGPRRPMNPYRPMRGPLNGLPPIGRPPRGPRPMNPYGPMGRPPMNPYGPIGGPMGGPPPMGPLGPIAPVGPY